MTDKNPVGWLFYDGQCAFCRRSLRMIMPALRQAGFEAVPLQEPWVARRLAIPADRLMDEMRVLTPDGRLVGGADAFVYLARFIPWLWPLRLVARVPGAMPLLRRGYRWIAARRRCQTDACPVRPQPRSGVKP